jgi:hypothetical protein
MNWEAMSAIAEWLGVILVVISLTYLAFQVRQNTSMVKAATELETGRQWSEFLSRMAHSADMADIWDKGLTGANELTEREKRKFIWLVAEYFFLVETLYRQREFSYLSQESWFQHQRAAAGLLAHPLLDAWWESGVSPFSPEFKATIEGARKDLGDSVWAYSPLSEL